MSHLPNLVAQYWPCGSLLRLPRVGGHGLWHVDVVPVAVVGVHPVGVRRRTLVCSSAGTAKYRRSRMEFHLLPDLWIPVERPTAGLWRCSRWVLHHPAPLDLHPLQYLVLMESLHRGPQRRHMVRQGLVVRRQVLGQWGTWTGEVVGGKRRRGSRGNGVAWRVGWQWRVKGDSVGNNVFALWRGLRGKLGVPMRVRTGGGGLMMQWAC